MISIKKIGIITFGAIAMSTASGMAMIEYANFRGKTIKKVAERTWINVKHIIRIEDQSYLQDPKFLIILDETLDKDYFQQRSRLEHRVVEVKKDKKFPTLEALTNYLNS